MNRLGSRTPPAGAEIEELVLGDLRLERPVGILRHSGSSASRPIGSITAPDRMWAPTSEPFSTTTTEISPPLRPRSCFRRIAVARPAGPAPTMTTSNSIDSRAGRSIVSPGTQHACGAICFHMNKLAAILKLPHRKVLNRSICRNPQWRRKLWRANECRVVHAAAPGLQPSMHDRPRPRRRFTRSLDFHVEAGVDLALDEAPHNRFAEAAPPAAASEPAAARSQSRRRPGSNCRPPPPPRPLPARRPRARRGRALARANRRARPRHSRPRRDSCPGSMAARLKFSARNLVFCDGNPQGRVMLVGRGAGRRRGPDRQALRGPLRPVARPHAGRHRPRPDAGLYRQRRALASAGKPHADAAGDRHLHAFHRAPDRTGRSGIPPLPRRSRRRRTCSTPRRGFCAPAAAGSPTGPRTGGRSGPCRRCTRPISCASRCRSGSAGGTFRRLRRALDGRTDA